MNPKRPSRRRIVGFGSLIVALVAASLSLASVPVGAQSATSTNASSGGLCPMLSVANPSPGNTLMPGSMIISGSASDPAATQGAGITRVDLFLGEREQGGTILGSAVPGTVAGEAANFWSVEVTIPSTLNRGVDFAAYAISSVTGQETVVTFPVFVGTPTKSNVTPTPVPTTMNVTSTCANGPATSASTANASSSASSSNASSPAGGQSTSVPMASTSTGSTSSTSGANACPILSVANPQPGNTIVAGGLVISGSAYDPAATQGSGIARVDLFLGEQEQGGTILGSAVPGANGSDPRMFSIEVQVPKLNRGVDFAAYAISAVTGQETAVTFPVFVGVPTTNGVATPTPVPTTMNVTNTCGSR
jgi:hypothetical protein